MRLRQKKKSFLFFLFSYQSTWSRQNHLLRCSRTAQNISRWWHGCSVSTRLSELTLAVLMNLYTWHSICITKWQIWLQCSFTRREKKTTNGLSEAYKVIIKSDYQISGEACEQLSTAQNIKGTCVTTFFFFCALLNFYLRLSCTPRAFYCLLQPPVWLRAARVSALTYWREPEESCWAAEANDELYCEW